MKALFCVCGVGFLFALCAIEGLVNSLGWIGSIIILLGLGLGTVVTSR